MIKKFQEYNINEKVNTHFNQNEIITEMARIDALNHKTQKILKGHQIWVYGDDRTGMTPHFHFCTADKKTFHIEISLIDLSIVHIKHNTNLKKPYFWEDIGIGYRKMVYNWVASENNYNRILEFWDGVNPNNMIGEDKRKEIVKSFKNQDDVR